MYIHDTEYRQADETGTLMTCDGISLSYVLHHPAGARGTVVIVQGRSDYIEKYGEAMTELASAGYAIASFDLRGQGSSGRLLGDLRTGHVHRFSDYTDDLQLFLQTHVLGKLPAPYTLLGYSLGGLISLAAAQAANPPFDGLVLVAPFVGLHGQIYPEPFIRFFSRTMCTFGWAEHLAKAHPGAETFENQNLTSDRRRYDRNMKAAKSDPPYLLGSPTYGWLAECLAAAKRVRQKEALSRVGLPTLVLSAGSDGVIPAAPQKKVAEGLGARHVVVPGSRHDLLQERDAMRDAAMAEILSFLETVKPR
ncbi:alpha/beta fold hydrolase [Martelella endophytica]|uniref:alpha/beta fold hydrolase n=1 Tax=Martelella endophytica TaxID=1486262 RepID=UPI000698B1A3|nr:alpha/beta hydrolase [Martelella endophytica]